MNEFVETFRHEDENEGRERVTLSDSSGRLKRRRGDAIDENGIKGCGDEGHYPPYPHLVKAKSLENALNITPT